MHDPYANKHVASTRRGMYALLPLGMQSVDSTMKF